MVIVEEWLTSIGLGYAIPSFKRHGVLGPEKLSRLELDDFEDFGVLNSEDRKKLFFLVHRVRLAVEKRKNRPPTAKSKEAKSAKMDDTDALTTVVYQNSEAASTMDSENFTSDSTLVTYSMPFGDIPQSNRNTMTDKSRNRNDSSLVSYVPSDEANIVCSDNRMAIHLKENASVVHVDERPTIDQKGDHGIDVLLSSSCSRVEHKPAAKTTALSTSSGQCRLKSSKSAKLIRPQARRVNERSPSSASLAKYEHRHSNEENSTGTLGTKNSSKNIPGKGIEKQSRTIKTAKIGDISRKKLASTHSEAYEKTKQLHDQELLLVEKTLANLDSVSLVNYISSMEVMVTETTLIIATLKSKMKVLKASGSQK